jgi:hypothetical protein
MSENKGLGLDNLKQVDWLNDNAPAPAAETEETQAVEDAEEKISEPAEETQASEQPEQELLDAVEDNDTPVSKPVLESKPEPEAEIESSIIETLTERLGYAVEGNFEDDFDGLTQYTSAVANKMAEEQVGQLFEQFPDVKEYFQYRANNGDPQAYFQAQQAEMDYNSIEISESDVAIQKRVVQDGMRAQGFGEEEVLRMTEAYEDAGILKDNADVYLTQLKKKQEHYKSQLIERQKEEAEQHRTQAANYWNSVSETIQNGQLKGMQIPTKQRRQFYDWMTQPVEKSGVTQRDKDRSGMDMETALALEYLIYQGFDLSKLAKNVSNTQKTKSLKEKLQSKPSASTRMKSRSKSSVTKSVSLPDLRDLL